MKIEKQRKESCDLLKASILRARTELAKNRNAKVQQSSQETALMEELSAQGVPVHKVPDNVHPGMPFVLMNDLAGSVTDYTAAHLKL